MGRVERIAKTEIPGIYVIKVDGRMAVELVREEMRAPIKCRLVDLWWRIKLWLRRMTF